MLKESPFFLSFSTQRFDFSLSLSISFSFAMGIWLFPVGKYMVSFTVFGLCVYSCSGWVLFSRENGKRKTSETRTEKFGSSLSELGDFLGNITVGFIFAFIFLN